MLVLSVHNQHIIIHPEMNFVFSRLLDTPIIEWIDVSEALFAMYHTK